MDLALNNLKRLICHKNQQTKLNQTINYSLLNISNPKPFLSELISMEKMNNLIKRIRWKAQWFEKKGLMIA